MTKLGIVAIVAGAVCVAGSAMAQDIDPNADPITAKKSPCPVDRLDEAAKISAARIVVGLMAEPKAPHVDEEKLLVVAELPEDWGGESACMRLISPDALYEGMAEYAIGAHRAGGPALVQFPISEEHWDRIRPLAKDLAVAFTRGRCDEPPGAHAIVRWPEDSPDRSRRVRLLVNSQGATNIFANLSDKPSIPCARSSVSGVGYDSACLLDRSVFGPGTTVAIGIDRLSYGSFEEPETVTLEQLPDP